jgi:bifunctional non-homologous end joining protein LigD
VDIPRDCRQIEVEAGRRKVRLTNLKKVFWPESGLTKRDLLQYYADISEYLLPHLRNRAMVMKRYPNGIEGKFFFMKRAPMPRPDWIETCEVEHSSGNVIAFPMIQDLAALLWVVNLGCIDLNPWYAKCQDVTRPDYLHFDLDPGPGAGFEKVREASLCLRDALLELKIQSYPKTTGSRGIHVYIRIRCGPVQKDVWRFSKELAKLLASRHPELITAEYRIAKRPEGRVLVDYNQNAWGRTLASVYSVRPKPRAPVSAPLSWQEIEGGAEIEDFRLDTMPERLRERGDLYKPILQNRSRLALEKFL